MTDFDRSGTNPGQRVRTYLGPSLGWVETVVRPTRNITSVGSFNILPGDGGILVNVAGLVAILLPDLRLWVPEAGYQPATAFERSIWIKDIGGNAAAFPITVTPFGIQTIDLLSSLQILQARQLVRLYPLPDNISGWFSG
jgi:hypothetical protein